MKKRFGGVLIVAFCGLVVVSNFLAHRPLVSDATFVLLDGMQKNTSELFDQVGLTSFWATSCVPCVAKTPERIEIRETLQGQGFTLLAVAAQYDAPNSVRRFLHSKPRPFDVAIDTTRAITQSWGDVQGNPSNGLLNKKGVIERRYVGKADFFELQRSIATVLRDA